MRNVDSAVGKAPEDFKFMAEFRLLLSVREVMLSMLILRSYDRYQATSRNSRCLEVALEKSHAVV